MIQNKTECLNSVEKYKIQNPQIRFKGNTALNELTGNAVRHLNCHEFVCFNRVIFKISMLM